MRVFVYGTLKAAYWNHRLLAGATFLGEAFTEKRYAMYGSGVPYIIPTEQGFPVKGEVYEIDESVHLPGLDRLEGHPNVYTRTNIMVQLLSDGEVVESAIYEMNHSRYKDEVVAPSKGYYEWSY